jgi:hypothetical protein
MSLRGGFATKQSQVGKQPLTEIASGEDALAMTLGLIVVTK